jgi:hypothetical protein
MLCENINQRTRFSLTLIWVPPTLLVPWTAVQSANSTTLPTPATFHHFRWRKFNFYPLSFTFKTFGKKFEKTKNTSRVNVTKIKQKN